MKKNFTTGLGKSAEADRTKLSRQRRQILRELGLSEEPNSTELAERLPAQAKTNRTLVKTLEEKDRELARMDLILSVRNSEIKVKEARIAELASRVVELGGGQEVRWAERPFREHPAPIRKCNGNATVVPRPRVSGMWKAAGDRLCDRLCHTPGGEHSVSDCAHGCELLRNLTYTMQTFPDDPWSLDMLDLLRDSVHHRNENDIGDAVPPTNNDSEKALRPAKTKLKVSGCFRSEEGAGNYATVASVIQTATGNGQNPFEFLRVIAILAQA